MSDVRPRGRLTSTADLWVGAAVNGELTVRLLSTRTCGTVWRSSAAASREVGRVSLSARRSSVSVRDPNPAYQEMVHEMVTGVTHDLRPTWTGQ